MVDHILHAVSDQFDQQGYQTYKWLEDLMFKAYRGEEYHEEFKFVTEFYDSHLPKYQLETQLTLLHHLFKPEQLPNLSLPDIIHALNSLSLPERVSFTAVATCMKLLLVIPASNATSERSFSALRRVKTYLRTTMTQLRLNNLMILHIHQERTDSLNLMHVAQEFVARRETRLRMFGKCE